MPVSLAPHPSWTWGNLINLVAVCAAALLFIYTSRSTADLAQKQGIENQIDIKQNSTTIAVIQQNQAVIQNELGHINNTLMEHGKQLDLILERLP